MQQNTKESVTNEHDKEVPKERYVSPEEKARNYWWTKIKTIKKYISKRKTQNYW